MSMRKRTVLHDVRGITMRALADAVALPSLFNPLVPGGMVTIRREDVVSILVKMNDDLDALRQVGAAPVAAPGCKAAHPLTKCDQPVKWSDFCESCYLKEFGEEPADQCGHGHDPNHVLCDECVAYWDGRPSP